METLQVESAHAVLRQLNCFELVEQAVTEYIEMHKSEADLGRSILSIINKYHEELRVEHRAITHRSSR